MIAVITMLLLFLIAGCSKNNAPTIAIGTQPDTAVNQTSNVGSVTSVQQDQQLTDDVNNDFVDSTSDVDVGESI